MRRAPAAPALLLAVLAGLACDDGRTDAAARETARTDRRAGAGVPRAAAEPAHLIDPATVRPGDRVADLTVDRVEVERLQADSTVWTGSVGLRGDLVLDGVFVPHFDYPDVPALCFHPDSASAARIPRFSADRRSSPDRKRWFCFRNPDRAASAFAPPDRPREARVAISGYTVHRYFTDAWDEATLDSVLALGAERSNTLREPPPQPGLGTAFR